MFVAAIAAMAIAKILLQRPHPRPLSIAMERGERAFVAETSPPRSLESFAASLPTGFPSVTFDGEGRKMI